MSKVPSLAASAVALLLVACRTTTPPVDDPPATPAGVVAEARDGGFALSWDANDESDLEGYAASWGEREGPTIGEAFVPAPETTVEVTGLVNYTEYAYRLTARDRAGNDSPAAAGVVTPVDLGRPVVVDAVLDVDPATHRATVLLTFSEPMDKEATEAAFSVSPGGACTISWPSDTEMRCAGLQVAQYTTYSVSVTTAAEDEAGNALDEGFGRDFEVGDLLPRVTSVAPSVGALNVGVLAPITVTFSEPMVSVQLNRYFLVTVDGELVAGDVEWAPDKTRVTFTPTEQYGYSKLVTWRVSGLIDSELNNMTPDPEGSFTTRFLVGAGR